MAPPATRWMVKAPRTTPQTRIGTATAHWPPPSARDGTDRAGRQPRIARDATGRDGGRDPPKGGLLARALRQGDPLEQTADGRLGDRQKAREPIERRMLVTDAPAGDRGPVRPAHAHRRDQGAAACQPRTRLGVQLREVPGRDVDPGGDA